jgi:hypothetical protein
MEPPVVATTAAPFVHFTPEPVGLMISALSMFILFSF